MRTKRKKKQGSCLRKYNYYIEIIFDMENSKRETSNHQKKRWKIMKADVELGFQTYIFS
ncbi:hypothetical protein BOVA604_248 [Bacteroides ovatus]|nr:hypothetical protein BOVA604_248 [Bacteroides ovatus]